MAWLLLGRNTLYLPYTDFNLYYFGGFVERHSTYTDTATVLHLVSLAGVHSTQNPVYGSPTLVGLIFQPLSFVDIHTAQWIFRSASLAALVVALRTASPRNWPFYLVACAVSFTTLLGLQLGNASTLVSALIIGAYGAMRSNRSLRAGVLIAIAACLKVYPAFLLVPVLVLKDWKAAKSFVVTSVVLIVASVPALGVAGTKSALRSLVGVADGGTDFYPINLSVPSFFHHWFGPFAGSASSVSMLLAIAGYSYNHKRVGRAEHFALIVPAMLASQSLTWNHYLLATVPALIVLLEIPTLAGSEKLTAVVLWALSNCVNPQTFDWVFGSSAGGPVENFKVLAPLLFAIASLIGLHRLTARPASTTSQPAISPV